MCVDLQRLAYQGLITKTALDKSDVDYVLAGTVIQEVKTSNIAREAAINAGFPASIGAHTVAMVRYEYICFVLYTAYDLCRFVYTLYIYDMYVLSMQYELTQHYLYYETSNIYRHVSPRALPSQVLQRKSFLAKRQQLLQADVKHSAMYPSV